MEVKLGYKQTEVGVIPEDWEVQPIGKSYEIHNNFRLPLSQKVRDSMAGPYPYYGPTSIQGYINEYRFDGKFALIGEDGDHFLKWRDIPMTLLVEGKFNVNNHAHAVKGTKNLTEWFYHFFSNRDLTRYLTKQGAGRLKLTKKVLIQIPCVLPSLPEQRTIATALADADARITSLDQLIAKKRDIKQAAMQKLLTGKRRLPGFEGEWKIKKLNEVCKRITTGYLDANAMKENGEFPFFTCAREHYWIDKYAFDADALLISGNGANVGYIHHYNGKFNAYQRTYVMTDFEEKIDFIKYFMDLNLQQRIRIEVNAGNTPYITRDTLADMQIKIPIDTSEQIAIATVLSDIDAELTALEQQRDKMKNIKQGMMQELLTGRIRLV